MSVMHRLGIHGIKPKDLKFEKMISIYNSCIELNIEVPKKILEYFGLEFEEEFYVSEYGVSIDYLQQNEQEKLNFMEEYVCEERQERGYILDISKLPKDITKLKIGVTIC